MNPNTNSSSDLKRLKILPNIKQTDLSGNILMPAVAKI